MAVVKRMKIGNTRITICDDYAVKTEEEKRAIINRLSDMVGTALQNGATFVEELPKDRYNEKVIYCDENWQPLPT